MDTDRHLLSFELAALLVFFFVGGGASAAICSAESLVSGAESHMRGGGCSAEEEDYADFYRAYSAYQLPHEVSARELHLARAREKGKETRKELGGSVKGSDDVVIEGGKRAVKWADEVGMLVFRYPTGGVRGRGWLRTTRSEAATYLRMRIRIPR
eukprot:170669-Rhodomonas_salina.3